VTPLGLPLVGLDFETYYHTAEGYTLRKLTIEEYVRDKRFEVICLSVVDLRNGGSERLLWGELEVRVWLAHAALEKACVVAQHAYFDSFILHDRFGVMPGAIACTRDMARPFVPAGERLSLAALARYFGLTDKGDEVSHMDGVRLADMSTDQRLRYGGYCLNDTYLALELYRALHDRFFAGTDWGQDELDLLALTLDCTVRGNWHFDTTILRPELVRLQREDAERLHRLGAKLLIAPAELSKMLNSGPKTAKLLQSLGIDPPMKISPRTGKETFAFAKDDEDFLALREHENPAVSDLVDARLGSKSSMRTNRAAKFLAIGERGPIGWPTIWQGAVASGRWSAQAGLNQQNLPKNRSAETPEDQEALRRCHRPARHDHVVIAADSGAIEARVVALIAGQTNLVNQFRHDEDVYSIAASATLGRHVTKKDKRDRQIGKTEILSCIAHGSLVLTDQGQVPIEKVTQAMRVWDGVEWVRHDGVVRNGVQDVIEFAGLSATPDHVVWTHEAGAVPLARAAAAGYRLVSTGVGAAAVALRTEHGVPAAAARGGARAKGVARHRGPVAVYDIVNAGPRHRFTVSGVLVHNCGFGAGAKSIAKQLKKAGVYESDEQADMIVRSYRGKMLDVVAAWRVCGKLIEWALRWAHGAPARREGGHEYMRCGRLTRSVIGEVDWDARTSTRTLRVQLPSGRWLYYRDLRTDLIDGEQVTSYMGRDELPDGRVVARRVKLYAGKLFANLVQGTARDIIGWQALQMLRRYGVRPAGHAHDELIYVVHQSLGEFLRDRLLDIMHEAPPWLQDMPLKAEAEKTCPGPSYAHV
jgi:hypothetical protein